MAYDDDLASVVAEEFPDVSYSISEYKRIDYAGDLRRKGEVLCTLFKKLESVEKNFKGTIFENLCSDTTFLFDKAGIRHWTEKDRIASKTFEKMEPMELETWYDKAYIMLLSCLVASQYLTIKKEVAEIKRIGSM